MAADRHHQMVECGAHYHARIEPPGGGDDVQIGHLISGISKRARKKGTSDSARARVRARDGQATAPALVGCAPHMPITITTRSAESRSQRWRDLWAAAAAVASAMESSAASRDALDGQMARDTQVQKYVVVALIFVSYVAELCGGLQRPLMNGGARGRRRSPAVLNAPPRTRAACQTHQGVNGPWSKCPKFPSFLLPSFAFTPLLLARPFSPSTNEAQHVSTLALLAVLSFGFPSYLALIRPAPRTRWAAATDRLALCSHARACALFCVSFFFSCAALLILLVPLPLVASLDVSRRRRRQVPG